VEPAELMQRMTHRQSGFSGESPPPEGNLDMRIKGEPVYGLTPYYPDMRRIVAHYLAKGFSPSLRVMQPEGQEDWYVDYSADGDIRTLIKCTSREVKDTGVEYKQGKMVRSKGAALPMCRHTIVLPEQRVAIDIDYVRAALPEWKRIQARAIESLKQFSVGEHEPKH
jgi:hypothetical protein